VSLYRANVELLSSSTKVTDEVALALDYGLLGDAFAGKPQALVYYRQADELWEKLRDSGQLPPRYSGKPDEMRSAASRRQSSLAKAHAKAENR
jgi:hypothetical protein